MIYSEFDGLKISRLGFGLMRLPLKDGHVDEEKTRELVDYAIKNGINYFDTAAPYHDGESEIVIGKILKDYPRDSFFLASKYPGHQKSSNYDPEKTFNVQLKKCQVDYFDFYLLHNVCENSLNVYENEEYKIIDYFVSEKKKGRIKHLGFSTHARVETLEYILNKYSDVLEFCQIQFNYLDSSLQEAQKKYDLITKYHLPVWVMEPLRGSKLALLDDKYLNLLKQFGDHTPAFYSFEWLKKKDNCKVILSGMNKIEYMKENIEIFSKESIMNEKIEKVLFKIADELKDSVPCTKCGYCKKGCPKELDIPTLIGIYNDLKYLNTFNSTTHLDALDKTKRPDNCLKCNACVNICPQKINIPKVLEDLDKLYKEAPSWDEISLKRDRIQKEIEEKLA